MSQVGHLSVVLGALDRMPDELVSAGRPLKPSGRDGEHNNGEHNILILRQRPN